MATHEANDDKITLTTDDNSTKVQALGDTVVIDGQWYHVAAMREGTTTKVYVNGVLDSQFVYTPPLTTGNSAGVRIGNNSAGDSALDGRLDEIVILTRAKSNQDIAKAAGAYAPFATYRSSSKDAQVSKPWNRFQWTEDLAYGAPKSGQTNLTHLYHLDNSTPVDSEGSIDNYYEE